MKSLKMLGLVVAAAAALTASLGVGSASATVLCEEFAIPCPAGKIYAVGQTVGAALAPKGVSTFRNTEGVALNSCSSSVFAGTTANEGKKGERVKGGISTFDFAGCSNATAVLENGSFEIEYVPGENATRANLTFKGTKFTITPFGAFDCVYGAATGTFIGTMTGGEPGVIHVNATFFKLGGSFLCPTDVTWEAPYEITAPYPVYFKEE